MTPLEQHCADFILRYCRGPEYKDYRRRCMELWRREYGDAVANKIEKIVRSKWEKKNG